MSYTFAWIAYGGGCRENQPEPEPELIMILTLEVLNILTYFTLCMLKDVIFTVVVTLEVLNIYVYLKFISRE